MGQYLKKLTVATAISLLSLGTIEANKANSATLSIGKYGSWLNSRELLNSVPRNDLLSSTVVGRRLLSDNSNYSQIATAKTNLDSATKDKLLQQQLEQQLKTVPQAEKLNQKVQDSYQAFLDNPNVASQELEEIETNIVNELSKYNNPDAINRDIQNRYQGLIDTETEQLNLLAARKLIMAENNELGAEFNSGGLDARQMQESLALLQSQDWIEASPTPQPETIKFPLPLTVGILLLIGWRASYVVVPLLKALGYSIDQGIGEDLREKYGSPKVPDNAVALHDRTFKELRSLAYKAERIASEKFGNEEFMLYVRLKQQVEQSMGKYKQIGESIKLLEVSLAAQSSFLKIESTELRFRSRKQQEFYNFVADNLENGTNRVEFRNKIKRKLAEIIPLLNSEEGRAALESYLKEVNQISQHSLGLKLLALFKKYQLADFTILRTISDIVKQLEARDLLDLKSLVVLILEHLEVFEKLAPILGISEGENVPETYAQMMQYMGLVYRHATAYDEFVRLIKLLKKWQKPYKSLVTIRETYPAAQYRLPPEFTKDIPGLPIFKKYENHLESIE